MGKKRNRWSYSAGHPPHTVRVYERKDSPNIYLATWDAENGREVKRSLGHADREKAKALADDLAPRLRKGERRPERGDTTVGRIFRLYRTHRVPDKSEKVQEGDDRRLNRWKAFLGAGFDLSKMSRREWDTFKRKRASGSIDAKGEPVPASVPCPACDGEGGDGCTRCDGEGEIDPRRSVGTRTVEKDLRFLRSVCRWAMDWRDGDAMLLDREPTRGFKIPKEKNPSRPVATHDRVDAIREVYREPTMRLERGGKRRTVESWLPEIFDLVVSTGRRIGAICKLKVEDLQLDRTPKRPHGAIVWPEDTDKMDKRWECPLSVPGRKAVDAALKKRERVLERVGSGPLFPAPGNPDEPVRYEEVATWMRTAETKAEIEPHNGSLFHAYRRLWATSRKDLPDVDVAKAGGWSSLQALQDAYQHPDDETMLRVVEHDAELREVR